METVDPFSQAASTLIQCKQFTDGISNLWITQNKKGGSIPTINYFSAKAEKVSLVAHESLHQYLNADQYKNEIYHIEPDPKNDIRLHKNYKSIKLLLNTKEFNSRPFILRMVKETNGNLFLVLYNYMLQEKFVPKTNTTTYEVDRSTEEEGKRFLLITECAPNQS